MNSVKIKSIKGQTLTFIGNMNGSQFEVYALLGKVYGSGCLLGYLLLSSNNGHLGGKECYLTMFLKYFKKKWLPNVKITLTNKDLSEINAFLTVYPEAKHQLCFWHCLQAIKSCLAVLRCHPKFYNVLEAKKEFDWIDLKFVPTAQSTETDPVSAHL